MLQELFSFRLLLSILFLITQGTPRLLCAQSFTRCDTIRSSKAFGDGIAWYPSVEHNQPALRAQVESYAALQANQFDYWLGAVSVDGTQPDRNQEILDFYRGVIATRGFVDDQLSLVDPQMSIGASHVSLSYIPLRFVQPGGDIHDNHGVGVSQAIALSAGSNPQLLNGWPGTTPESNMYMVQLLEVDPQTGQVVIGSNGKPLPNSTFATAFAAFAVDKALESHVYSLIVDAQLFNALNFLNFCNIQNGAPCNPDVNRDGQVDTNAQLDVWTQEFSLTFLQALQDKVDFERTIHGKRIQIGANKWRPASYSILSDGALSAGGDAGQAPIDRQEDYSSKLMRETLWGFGSTRNTPTDLLLSLVRPAAVEGGVLLDIPFAAINPDEFREIVPNWTARVEDWPFGAETELNSIVRARIPEYERAFGDAYIALKFFGPEQSSVFARGNTVGIYDSTFSAKRSLEEEVAEIADVQEFVRNFGCGTDLFALDRDVFFFAGIDPRDTTSTNVALVGLNYNQFYTKLVGPIPAVQEGNGYKLWTDVGTGHSGIQYNPNFTSELAAGVNRIAIPRGSAVMLEPRATNVSNGAIDPNTLVTRTHPSVVKFVEEGPHDMYVTLRTPQMDFFFDRRVFERRGAIDAAFGRNGEAVIRDLRFDLNLSNGRKARATNSNYNLVYPIGIGGRYGMDIQQTLVLDDGNPSTFDKQVRLELRLRVADDGSNGFDMEMRHTALNGNVYLSDLLHTNNQGQPSHWENPFRFRIDAASSWGIGASYESNASVPVLLGSNALPREAANGGLGYFELLTITTPAGDAIHFSIEDVTSDSNPSNMFTNDDRFQADLDSRKHTISVSSNNMVTPFHTVASSGYNPVYFQSGVPQIRRFRIRPGVASE